jgi:hypothetical protein
MQLYLACGFNKHEKYIKNILFYFQQVCIHLETIFLVHETTTAWKLI